MCLSTCFSIVISAYRGKYFPIKDITLIFLHFAFLTWQYCVKMPPSSQVVLKFALFNGYVTHGGVSGP